MTIPLSLLALDALGVMLLGLGLAERFADTDLVPAALQFPNYDIVMMVFGVALMLPVLKHVISQAANNAKQQGKP